MKHRLWLIVALALVPFASAWCKPQAEAAKITVATDATWPPMEFVNEAKKIVGFDIDLMKAVAKAGGFAVEFKNTAWDGIFAGLANGEYDAVISSVTITDERKKTHGLLAIPTSTPARCSSFARTPRRPSSRTSPARTWAPRSAPPAPWRSRRSRA